MNDDEPLQLTPQVPTQSIEDNTFTVTVTSDRSPDVPVTIPISIVGATATVPGDVDSPSSGSITIPVGQFSGSFVVHVADDDLPEPTETFRIDFGTPNQGTLTETTRTVSVLDDDPQPYRVTVRDVTVLEGDLVQLSVTAAPTGPVAPGADPVTLPAFVSDVSTQGAADWSFSNEVEGSITFPAVGGTVVVAVIATDNREYEDTEVAMLTVGRAGVPGEQGSALIEIEDDVDNDFPVFDVLVSSPVSEKSAPVSLIVEMDRTADVPITFELDTVDGFAEAGEDFVAVHTTLTIPAGSTRAETVFLELVDDTSAFELTRELFGVQVTRGSDILAFRDVVILNDDRGPQARFVRGSADEVNEVFARRLVEGTSSNATLPLVVELLGDPITEPTTVIVNFASASPALTDADYDLAPLELVFQPGDTTRTVTFTSLADANIESDETLIIALQTEFGDLLGRVDDEAQVTIRDDDAAPAGTPVEQFHTGWGGLLSGFDAWLAQFDLQGRTAPAVVTPSLAQHFDLASLIPDLDLPTLNPADDTLPELCASLLAAGFTLQGVAGGFCGAPEPARQGDVISATFDVTLEDLVKAAGFTGDPFNDATQGLLRSLASSLGLNGQGGWTSDLSVDIQVGIDAGGFYIDGSSSFALDVGGSLNVTGRGNLAGAGTTFTGVATSDLSVRLVPPVARLRDLGDLFDARVDGTTNLSVSFAAGPLSLQWSGKWTMGLSGVAVGPQTITGALALPGLRTGAAGASLTVTGDVGRRCVASRCERCARRRSPPRRLRGRCRRVHGRHRPCRPVRLGVAAADRAAARRLARRGRHRRLHTHVGHRRRRRDVRRADARVPGAGAARRSVRARRLHGDAPGGNADR